MRYSDSQAIPSSQLAICSYTYPLVELVGFLPCPCVLVHIVYLLHINLKKKKKGHCQSHITIFGTLSHRIPDQVSQLVQQKWRPLWLLLLTVWCQGLREFVAVGMTQYCFIWVCDQRSVHNFGGYINPHFYLSLRRLLISLILIMVIRYVFYRFLLYFYYIFGYLTMMLCHCLEDKSLSIISFFIN